MKKLTLLPSLALQFTGIQARRQEDKGNFLRIPTLIWILLLSINPTVEDDMLCVKAWAIQTDRHVHTHQDQLAIIPPRHSISQTRVSQCTTVMCNSVYPDAAIEQLLSTYNLLCISDAGWNYGTVLQQSLFSLSAKQRMSAQRPRKPSCSHRNSDCLSLTYPPDGSHKQRKKPGVWMSIHTTSHELGSSRNWTRFCLK